MNSKLPEQKFDIVIVGGGTAGCVLASRISSARSDLSILVIEAGVEQDDRVLPALGYIPGFGSSLEWEMKMESQPGLGGNVMNGGGGKILGGSSAINYQNWSRGSSVDYDQWVELVNDQRWSWKGLLPYFKASETFIPSEQMQKLGPVNSEIHGTNGPIKVSCVTNSGRIRKYPLREKYANFNEIMGACLINDMNAGNILGYGEAISSTHDGSRQYAVLGYKFGDNVTVWFQSTVEKLILQDKRAIGAIVSRVGLGENGQTRREVVLAGKEILLAAGALSSPKILMLSGIGPDPELRKHDISTVTDLPVGQGLSDHPAVETKWILSEPNASLGAGKILTADCDWLSGAPMDWIAFHRVDEKVMVKAHDYLNRGSLKYYAAHGKAHLESFWMYGNFDSSKLDVPDDPPPGKSLVTIFNIVVNPVSRGSLKLRSGDSKDAPMIDPNMLSSPLDREAMYGLVRKTSSAILQVPQLGAIELIDDSIRDDWSDEGMSRRVKLRGRHMYHPCGTCAMGKVVDAECRVFGIEGLRVVDASIIPIPLSAHYQATTYAMAEQAVGMILNAI